MVFSKLCDISPDSRSWNVRVRVSRMWEYCGARDGAAPLHVDLVLIDDEGNSIYAEVPGRDADRIKTIVKEGDVYKLSKFIVSSVKPSYRPFVSKYMIKITPWTMVEPVDCVDESFPRFVYNLFPLSDLSSRVGSQLYFTDVLAMITGVSRLSFVRLVSSTTDTARRTVVLKDLSGYEMKLVLWGARAVDFDADSVFETGQEHHVVGIFVGLLVKAYQGEPSLSGGPACKWYLNEAIPEVEEFYDRLGDEVTKIEWVSADNGACMVRGATGLEQKTVAELRAMDPWEVEDTSFLCTVTVARLGHEQQWWFSSCPKCHKAANPYGSEYRCSGSCGSVNAIPKYRLCLICSDGTSAAEFVLFGRAAQQIVGKSVMALMRCDGVPREIAAVVTQKFTFAVSVSKKSLMQRNISFQVNSVETFFGRQACVPDVRDFEGEMDDGNSSANHRVDSPPVVRKRRPQREMPSVVKKNMHPKMIEPSKAVAPAKEEEARLNAASSDGRDSVKKVPATTRKGKQGICV